MSKKKNNLLILMLTLLYYCAVGQQIPNQPSVNKGPNLDAAKLSYDVSARGQSPQTKPQSTPTPLGKPSYANVASNQQPKPNIPNQPAPVSVSGLTTKRPSLITDNELRTFSEELLAKDTNNAAKYVNINLQSEIRKDELVDKAPKPLLTIKPDAYKIPSINAVRQFYDNYVQDLKQNEQNTADKQREIESFLDIILNTEVMKHAFNLLKSKGVVGQDIKNFRDKLRSIWFDHYSREKGKTGSSGFEHVFLSESKNGQVTGLHNWIYFNHEEVANRANYLGYIRNINLGQKGAALKMRFKYNNLPKPSNTLFVGTSPEFEMALYTVCYLLRADSQCPVKMNNVKFNIKTFNIKYNNKDYIGSAFPDIA